MLFACMAALSVACTSDQSPSGMVPMMNNADARQATLDVANRFADALASGQYLEARSLLTRGLQESHSTGSLQDSYGKMISYGRGPGSRDPNGTTYDNIVGWPVYRPRGSRHGLCDDRGR